MIEDITSVRYPDLLQGGKKMEKLISLLEEQLSEELEQIVLSNPRTKEGIFKVKIRPVLMGKKLLFQFTSYVGTKVYHENLDKAEAQNKICSLLKEQFKQLQLASANKEASALVSKKGTVTIKCRTKSKELARANCQGEPLRLSHNREKQYILKEGEVVPFLVDLGVQTKEGKIVRSRYDKFRQINRFLEFLDDIVDKLPKGRTISILDFGCGKSYLTFAMYYYLKVKRNYDIDVVGLDLKEDVIANCNSLKDKYGYEHLHFLQGDIKEYNEKEEVDMVVTLHACDTATDYALFKAVSWNAKVILSVPCCQHEINRQIENELFSPILKYGLLKERISALLTDGIRANLLEELGYDTQILEFIDLEHTPKNILIRAVKSEKIKKRSQGRVDALLRELNAEQTLYDLVHRSANEQTK